MKKYSGDFLISYPDRTLNFNGQIVNENPYEGNLRISWSADEAIDMMYSLGFELDDQKKVWAIAKVETPFAGWRMNKLNGTFLGYDNLISFNVDAVFAETQTISTHLFLNYIFSDHKCFIEGKTGIQSTIKDVPIVFSAFKYNQTVGALSSEIFFKHKNFISEEFRAFSIQSTFKTYSGDHKNVSGFIKFKSPLEHYKTGVMVTKFSISKERELVGIFDMDIDSRFFTFTVEGYLKKLLENMISFELTTPLDGFPYLVGNFGVSESKRHLIADLKTFNKSIGVDILFDFVSITEFDVKLYMATPQEAFEKLYVIGKIKEDTVHLEALWNKVRLGFKGISKFKSIRDFEYTYMIFTPLLHFEENGLVTKFVAQDVRMFDVESSFKLGKYKLGVMVSGRSSF